MMIDYKKYWAVSYNREQMACDVSTLDGALRKNNEDMLMGILDGWKIVAIFDTEEDADKSAKLYNDMYELQMESGSLLQWCGGCHGAKAIKFFCGDKNGHARSFAIDPYCDSCREERMKALKGDKK